MTTMKSASFELFGDEVVTSTDLNRRTGEILNHARRRPVTIARNSELFALLTRETAANLVQSKSQTKAAMELIQAVLEMRQGGEPTDTAFAWIKAFDLEDRLKMVREILDVMRAAFNGETEWENIANVIHEWSESAAVIASGVIDSVLAEPADEQEVTRPENAAPESVGPAPVGVAP